MKIGLSHDEIVDVLECLKHSLVTRRIEVAEHRNFVRDIITKLEKAIGVDE